VLRNDARRPRRNGGTQRRKTLASVETLEGRQLMAFSPLGVSQPDLIISGFTAPVAAWNGPLAVTVDIRNIAASTQVVPFSLAPGSTTPADAGPATVQVFITNGFPHIAKGVEVGQFTVPTIPSNSTLRISQTLTMPPQQPHFPIAGGNVFVQFVVTQSSTAPVPEANVANNSFISKQPVLIEPALPDLYAVGLNVPPVMQPGDTIKPNIEIANFGTVDSGLQGPFKVALVATTNKGLKGATILAAYTFDNVQALSRIPQTQVALGDVNINTPVNIDVLQAAPVTLPLRPRKYFLTVVVDPAHQILQLKDLSKHGNRSNGLITPFVQVGPPQPFLPPASGLSQLPSSQTTNPFPDPAFPVL
jgi:hypothetical protein